MPVRIVADENIPFLKAAFSEIGTIQLFAGREITSNNVKNADVLLVRSVTNVNAELLEGSSVKMVGSATIGTDHIDLDYLNQNEIVFSNAAGSNANSVAEYVIAAILELVVKYKIELASLKLGIVGVGYIGKIVKKMAQGLGISVLLNDPPVARSTGDRNYLTLDELMQADIITLHVPLTKFGDDNTFHLFDTQRIHNMKKGSILINTSRGPVVDNQALKIAINSQHLLTSILDVWENEPRIDLDLLHCVEIGTPHIAGYSLDGKANGTFQIYQAVCKYFDMKPIWEPKKSLPEIKTKCINKDRLSGTLNLELANLIRNVYPIRKDDDRFRKIFNKHNNEIDSYFDQLRKKYPIRREFHNYEISGFTTKNSYVGKIEAIGFKIGENS